MGHGSGRFVACGANVATYRGREISKIDAINEGA